MAKKWGGIRGAEKLTRKREKDLRNRVRFNSRYTAHQVAGIFDALDKARGALIPAAQEAERCQYCDGPLTQYYECNHCEGRNDSDGGESPTPAAVCADEPVCEDAPWPDGAGHYSRTGHCGCVMGTRRVCVKHCGGHGIPEPERVTILSAAEVRADAVRECTERILADEDGAISGAVKVQVRASRADALQDAAKVCERRIFHPGSDGGVELQAAADELRSLAEPDDK